MPVNFHHDYETYCELDIKIVGAEAYVRHHSFRILMCSYALGDDAVSLWVPEEGEPMPQAFLDAHNNPDVLLTGFNVGFERAVTRHGLGWAIPSTRYRCTMAKAYSLSFAGSMGDVGTQIGIPQEKQKLQKGSKLIQRFGKPAPKNHNANFYDRFSHPVEWGEFKGYCIQDTETERYIDRWCEQYHPMSAYEWRVWELDQEINQNGLPVDLDTAHRALALHQEARQRVLATMKTITGLDNPNSLPQLDGWLRATHGVVMPNFKAETIVATIKLGVIPQGALDILAMKSRVAMNAPAKWKAFLRRACPDWVLRGMFTYAGASRTWRWASRGINLQNLKTPSFSDMEAAIWFVRNASIETIEAVFGDAIMFLAETVRGGITAPEGEALVVSDLKSIESRVVGWISGCRMINDAFAQGFDTYKLMAVGIYGVTYEEVTSSQRKFSKPVFLAGPYGQGAKGLVKYAEGYGVDLTQSEAERHINTFRRKCHEIPKMWKWLDAAIMDAVTNGNEHTGYRVRIFKDRDFLFIELPSGRRLGYHHPKIEMKVKPWGESLPTFTYMGKDAVTNQWKRLQAFAGLITENITQAIARDILALGLMAAKDAGALIIGHVHDEILIRAATAHKDQWLAVLDKCMCVGADWTTGLLLDAEGMTTKNYTKG